MNSGFKDLERNKYDYHENETHINPDTAAELFSLGDG